MIFGRRKNEEIEPYIEELLDSLDNEMFVVREKDCDILFLNKAAQKRLRTDERDGMSCQDTYGKTFPTLCQHCPYGEGGPKASRAFDVADQNQNIFSVVRGDVEWMDGSDSSVFYLRDVTEERAANQKLYNLAYTDLLTGVPNRQRFKEDFEAVAADIAEKKKMGVVAIFDLDNFKAINDTYGHNTGDIMLKRLTGYLSAEPAFENHLYRLGGDEFVLFYADDATRFASEQDMIAYYQQLLQAAFVTYTMPNIESSCTISMGVALFPQHGATSSELLRKADIALYKAKASGRNTMVLFEDRYDAAKKFKDLYINIQPILTHLGRTYGYELIDQSTDTKGTEDAINLADFDRAIDALGLGEMEGEAKYFISYSNQLLSKTVVNNLPKDKFVIQVHATADISEKQLAKFKELRSYGFSLALVDIVPPNAPPALLELATFCKFGPGVPMQAQKRFIAENSAKRFVATDVDTTEAFDAAKQGGFKLFQGFFFNQPVVVKKSKDIDPLKVNYLRLIKLTSTDDYVNFQEISSVISSDVALSYKLLRLLNSAAVGLRNQISSIDMAVAYLGEESLKKWIALLALRGVASDKPLELVRISLIRAQFGELLSNYMAPKRNSKHVFLVGLFSLLHIALEKTKEELLDEIPVAEDIRLSLLTDSGPHSDLLSFFTNYEYGNWEEVSDFAKENHLSDKVVNDAYIAAVKWYNDLSDD